MPHFFLSKHLTVRFAKCHIMTQTWIIPRDMWPGNPKVKGGDYGKKPTRPLVLPGTSLPVEVGRVDKTRASPLSLNLSDLKQVPHPAGASDQRTKALSEY